eukprot:gene6087-8389_t
MDQEESNIIMMHNFHSLNDNNHDNNSSNSLDGCLRIRSVMDLDGNVDMYNHKRSLDQFLSTQNHCNMNINFVAPVSNKVQRRKKENEEFDKSTLTSKTYTRNISYSSTDLKKGLVWTAEMDDFLREAMVYYCGSLAMTNGGRNPRSKKWVEVAKFVNERIVNTATNYNQIRDCSYSQVNKDQCKYRWNFYVNPTLDDRITGPWSIEEVMNLERLVDSYRTKSKSPTSILSSDSTAINWMKVSKELNRPYFDCQNKWITISKSNMKIGRFTQEEDEIILKRAQEWGSKGKGLYVSLEKELNRRSDVIKNRLKNVLSKRMRLSMIPSSND